MCGIEKVYSSAYYPQGDGLAERMMRTLNNSLSCLSAHIPLKWDEFIPGIQYAYNTTQHDATGCSPFELNMGRLARIVGEPEYLDVTRSSRNAPKFSSMEYVRRLRNVIRDAQVRARQMMHRHWEKLRLRYRKSRRDFRLNVGDRVLIALTDSERGKFPIRKLAPRWSPPATVTGVCSNGVTYQLQTFDNKQRIIHISRLLPIDGTLWGKLYPQSTKTATADARRVPSWATVSAEECIPAQIQDTHYSTTNLKGTVVDNNNPATEEIIAQKTSPESSPQCAVSPRRWEVDGILRHRYTKRKGPELCVRWTGYDEPTWEPRQILLEDCPQLVFEYESKLPVSRS